VTHSFVLQYLFSNIRFPDVVVLLTTFSLIVSPAAPLLLAVLVVVVRVVGTAHALVRFGSVVHF
jgi:hypothetical protein